MSSYGYFVYADPKSGTLDIAIDYFVDPYTDPETGEYFSDTNYFYSFEFPVGSGGGGGGSGSESGSEYISLHIGELGPGVFDGSLFFRAENWFSAEAIEFNVAIRVSAYTPGPQLLDGAATDDIILAGYGDDTVNGLDGADYLLGAAGRDTLDGGADNDTLDGGGGRDALVGGEGDDRYLLGAGDTTIEQDGDGYDAVFASVSHMLSANIEQLLLLNAPAALKGFGNALANDIIGNNFANTLGGGSGADRLRGGSAADLLKGDGGADTLDGGSDADTMQGGRGHDAYNVDSVGDRVVERADQGVDTVVLALAGDYALGANVEHLTTANLFFLSDPSVRITGNALDNAITTTRDDDTLRGDDGDDTLSGLAGDDRFFAGTGADRVIGGDGFDTLDYSEATKAMRIDLSGRGAFGLAEGDRYESLERVIAGSGADTVLGDAADNVLRGEAGDDSLRGRDGNDLLIGGEGADALDGGEGFDRASFAGALGALVVDLSASTIGGPGAEADTIVRIEGVIGGAGDDVMTGNALANLLLGGGGADSLSGRDGDDTIGGGAGGDSLDGGDGLDVISYEGSLGGVLIRIAGQTATGGDADGDTLAGFEGAFGGEGRDTIAGDGGGNLLRGGASRDKVRGGGGDDTIGGGGGRDVLDGGDGIDTLSYADARTGVYVDLLFNASGGGDATGDAFTNFENLEGGNGSDALYADDGANAIFGLAGFDYITGRGGNDRLTGGLDSDIFSYESEFAGHDVVTDFETGPAGTDQLEFLLGFEYDSVEELLAIASSTGANGEHTIFEFSADFTVTLLNVALAELNASHFYFYEDF